jgi:hypothetical protein
MANIPLKNPDFLILFVVTCTFKKGGIIFVVQKNWNQLYEFMHSFLFFYKKKTLNTWLF